MSCAVKIVAGKIPQMLFLLMEANRPRHVSTIKIEARLSETAKKPLKTLNKTRQRDLTSGATLKADEEELLYK
jgi:hypothetical protein